MVLDWPAPADHGHACLQQPSHAFYRDLAIYNDESLDSGEDPGSSFNVAQPFNSAGMSISFVFLK
jgi:hypothetical protein